MAITMDEKDRLLTFAQAGVMAGVDRSTIQRWADDDLIDTIQLPSGRRKIWLSVMQKYLGKDARNG